MTTGHTLPLKGMLEHLTDLYYSGSDVYSHALADGRKELSAAFPGLTIVLAEVADRDYMLAMVHVLAPEMATTEHTIEWHDTMLAQFSLDGW